MKKRSILVFSLFMSMLAGLNAQRYFTPQFTKLDTTKGVQYGENFTVLYYSTKGRTVRDTLRCNIYQPQGDTVTSRPLVIFLHTGNFLSQDALASPIGDKSDSVVVEFCNRFAKLGYVTAAIDYRLGWNPTAGTPADKTNSLINAAYRGIQDVRSAIRFFKEKATVYKIDSTRIMVMGEGTGGYIAFGAATFDDYNEIINTKYPEGKFLKSINPVIPMVTQQYNGNIWGTAPDTATRNPSKSDDTLHIPSWSRHTSNHRLTVNLGGALGDITWLDAKSTPIISVACPHDQNAPYRTGVLGVRTPNGTLPVVEVQGSHWVALKADSLGINDAFKKLTAANDPYKTIISGRHNSYYYGDDYNTHLSDSGAVKFGKYATGLFPIIGRSKNDSAPYQWWDTTAVYGKNATSLATNPGMSAAKARLYIDSIMNFIVPRACLGLDLKPCAGLVSGTREVLALNAYLKLAPNPATNEVRFESEEINPMRAIELYDMSGRLVTKHDNINLSNYTLQRNGLTHGMYVAKVRFDSGVLAKKLMFEE
jgi:Secretion system C-terminal sorting domain/Carboxylesterase family